MASIERTAYPRFKRFMSARELHVFCTPQPDEIVWAREAASSDEHLLALVTQLKAFNRLSYPYAGLLIRVFSCLSITMWVPQRVTRFGSLIRSPLP